MSVVFENCRALRDVMTYAPRERFDQWNMLVIEIATQVNEFGSVIIPPEWVARKDCNLRENWDRVIEGINFFLSINNENY